MAQSNLNSRIGIAIKRCRQLKNLSQAALAAKAGITQSYVSQIEKGNANQRINLNTLQGIALALGMQLSELITLAENVPTLEQAIANILNPSQSVPD